MNHTDTSSLIASCAESALATMFFTAIVGPSQEIPAEHPSAGPGGCIRARVRFVMEPGGFLELAAEPQTLRGIASAFAAEETDAVSADQVEQTACELANVICGSVLRSAPEKSRFKLLPPVLVPEDSGALPSADVHSARLATEYGWVQISFAWNA